ncbi:transaldolase [Pusillimonas sp. CC-YST705]|uniref:Transaldolase n=1 Tax=Mesopusillimonas faecipullorum TaxID=2755040 RepID=A0ABS8CB40_9BURK|nr:transaldolase [Mesopusillimonas faecipullorum]MCB5363254.1 transaldolase [Mesopusillimonas faecipullorum]
MPTQLESLRQFTTVVADTGDVDAIRVHRPTDATTNPSLILKAVKQERYRPLLEKVVADNPHADLATLTDRLLVAFGKEILAIIPGRVSTEVDARLSFDTAATLVRAKHIIDTYAQAGIERERILIKIASTWEGIQAARALQAEGIACNLTLLFSLEQAIACGQAGVQLISPFVGRIYDWHKKQAGANWDEAAHTEANDPGVQSVRTIFHYYKAHGIVTEVMGASFRNIGQIRALAGCDLLTISPELLAELNADNTPLSAQLKTSDSSALALTRQVLDEVGFRTGLNENAMATEKLAEGIRAFVADALHLDALLEQARQK